MLNEKLKKKDISPDDFIRIQFSAKGYKPYPNQLLSKVAMQRYLDHISCITSEEINRTQESYLRELCEDGYTLEEALQFDIFYYYFRCSKLKDYPKNWLFLAQKEIEKTPELKNIKLWNVKNVNYDNCTCVTCTGEVNIGICGECVSNIYYEIITLPKHIPEKQRHKYKVEYIKENYDGWIWETINISTTKR